MKIKLIFLSLLPVFALAESYQVSSPTKKINVDISISGNVIDIDLQENGKHILQTKTLQFSLDKHIVEGNWKVENAELRNVDESWKPVYGERSLVKDQYNELILSLESDVNRMQMQLAIRAYDQGVAFRYLFDELDFWNRKVTSENTQFLFDDDCITWVTDRAQGAYAATTLSNLKTSADRPQIVKVKEDVYVAIGEAGLVDYSRMKLQKSDHGLGIQSILTGKVDLDLANYITPWRYIMVAESPCKLVENNDFILNLNEPNQIKNTNWIKPGKVIREVTLTTAGGLACVDFAAKNGIEYIEFDAGWYGPEDDITSDASTITVDPKRSKGPLDLHAVIEYANQKEIGVILYVNMKALHNQLDQILPLYKKWGVKGLKFGFVDVGDQYATVWLHHAVRKAAKYELLVDIHDEYRPTGYSRTYPNLLTQEGIRGDEESPTLTQTVYTLFNRMIAGAGDYTNCYFADRVISKMGGRAAQLAKLIAIYSPWQFIYWYDRPIESPSRVGGAGSAESVITNDAITDFYCTIPTVWDDTKFLAGEMGVYAVLARRSGTNWYISVLNAGEKRKVDIPIAFIRKTKAATAKLYFQPSANEREVVEVKNLNLKNSETISIEVEGNSGCVLFIPDK